MSVVLRESSENSEVRAEGLEERDGGESRRVRDEEEEEEEEEGRSERLEECTI